MMSLKAKEFCNWTMLVTKQKSAWPSARETYTDPSHLKGCVGPLTVWEYGEDGGLVVPKEEEEGVGETRAWVGMTCSKKEE